MRADVRRKCALSASDTTYTDTVVDGIIETYPLVDAEGYDPDDASWTDTYDLNAAAAAIWEEQAAALADEFDFNADGGSHSASQKYKNAIKMSRHFAARRKPGRIQHRSDPRITTGGAGELNE
jgi:hypothetical protein